MSQAKLLTAWIYEFAGREPSAARAMVRALGLKLRVDYSPVSCEICGYECEGVDNLGEPDSLLRLSLSNGQTLTMARFGSLAWLRNDNALCAGEAMLLGEGPDGKCGCDI